MVGRIRLEFQCLEESERKSKVWNNEIRILMFGRTRAEFECLER